MTRPDPVLCADTQYQRKRMCILRRKLQGAIMWVITVWQSVVRRVNLMFRNNNGIMMTEYNPNYEFAGGSCSIQDLREVDRENLVLVKWVAPQREILTNKYLIISELSAKEPLEKSTKVFSRTKRRRQKHPWLSKHCQNSLLIKVGILKKYFP